MITLKHHIKPFSNCFRPILLVLILGILFTSCQELNCEDFREGEFSHITEGDNSVEGTIVRSGSQQTEKYLKVPQEMLDSGFPTEPLPIRIEWIDDCSYRLFYDETAGDATETHRKIAASGGILTELVKIEGRCFHYKTSVTIDGNEYNTKGRICKK